MEPMDSGEGDVICGRRGGDLDDDDDDLAPCSPMPPHIAAEHSYSLCGDSRPQSPLSHLNGEQGEEEGEVEGGDSRDWPMEQEEAIQSLLSEAPSFLPALTLALIKEECVIPQIKLEPHEVDQFLNLSPKGLEVLHMPPTPPSSHGSDSEGSQSPVHAAPGLSCPPSPASPGASPAPSPGPSSGSPAMKGAARNSSSSLSNSPLLTAPHKLQGSGPLMLTEEERRTLVAEGYPVPTKLPLSKAEEKISAQESRRKKKEYMDALEKKVENCSNENHELRRKVDNLESLLQQLQSLQAAVVVVLCFAVFLVKSRSLLSTFEDEQPHLLGLGGEYPDQWEDTPAVVMAAWRRSEQNKAGGPASDAVGVAESRTPFRSNSNDTTNESTENQRLDLQRAAGSSSSSKVLALDRTVNETS
ncbi:hypothetical protein NHX12_020453 [Muraenolepis orangiensis]|uniref:Cyclic AMP-responsive element-binding protein 3-like protein 2 n=1 Tax=Muraenolepis orangiensis TaxID=630683 RepID=A0A9Q0IWN9_9TELE|nr:hypothetical protein NHX12_020453 [Muraenolepis orangiensis]